MLGIWRQRLSISPFTCIRSRSSPVSPCRPIRATARRRTVRLGAIVLASALTHLGARVSFVTDSVNHAPLARSLRGRWGLRPRSWSARSVPRAAEDWCREFLADSLNLTHLVAIERVGPSHTLDSLSAQPRSGPPPVEDFERMVPDTVRGRCLNMRGEPLDATTAPLHLLFEDTPRTHPHLKTIGICDGGNEIGMGRFAWETLHPLVNGGLGPRIACRTATDWTILAGTSNWEPTVLAAAVALIKDRPGVLADWTQQRQEEVLEFFVNDGPAVDGVTRLREPTVDGLPFISYIQPWNGIRETARPRRIRDVGFWSPLYWEDSATTALHLVTLRRWVGQPGENAIRLPGRSPAELLPPGIAVRCQTLRGG